MSWALTQESGLALSAGSFLDVRGMREKTPLLTDTPFPENNK
jgi:hypothetical protein